MTAALGANDAILERVRDADAISPADGVGLADRLDWTHRLAVDCSAPIVTAMRISVARDTPNK